MTDASPIPPSHLTASPTTGDPPAEPGGNDRASTPDAGAREWTTGFPVRFGDIDQAGIVYYPRFLHYCHVAMEDFFADHLRLPYPQLLAEHHLGFPTVQLDVTFRRPLRYGDRVTVALAIDHLGTSSLTWRFRLLRGDTQELLCTARAVTVCTDLERFVKVPIPGWLAARLHSTPSSNPRDPPP